MTPPGDLPSDASITFAKEDPVRIRCDHGQVQLTLAIDELRQGHKQWHDFSILATYEPEIEHLHIRLARQGAIEIGGSYKGQTEVALRGIFSKILPKDRKLELVPSVVADSTGLADLSINQCVIEDGWIGIAVGPERTATVAKGATDR